MIKPDIIEQSTIKRDKDGYSVDRFYIVDSVGGKAESRLYTAITKSGVPQFGDGHPTIPGIQVTSVSAAPISNSQIRIGVTYGVPSVDDEQEQQEDTGANEGTASVVLTTAVENEVVYNDINGELLLVTYNRYATVGDPTSNFQPTKFYGSATVQRPQLQAVFTRTENSLPLSALASHLGKVNSSPWSGYPAKTWLCTSISANEDKGKFEVSYTFNQRDTGWRAFIVVPLTRAEASDFPLDLDSGNGIARYDVYESADFNALGLSLLEASSPTAQVVR
jgi:hypothetical protein